MTCERSEFRPKRIEFTNDGPKLVKSAEAAMTDKVFNVLFLCTGNSARSIIAECILNRLGQGRFKAYSAGSHPKGAIHPYAIDLLKRLNFGTDGLRSKNWDEFAASGAPALDFVFTLCDEAAAEECPVWPGQPMTAHWGLPDPAAAEGNEIERRLAFADALRMLNNRISIFVSLPMRSLDKLSFQRRLNEIGQTAAQPLSA
jgi:arsenate reductase